MPFEPHVLARTLKLTSLKCVVKAWKAGSTEMIVSSFEACGISVAVGGSKDSSVHCLNQSEIAADAVLHISQLIAEMLAAPYNNDDDPVLSSDDDQDELETNQRTVEDTD